jgi:Tfp pilus assembly protein PilE
VRFKIKRVIHGFSIYELLIVVSIISLLSIFSYSTYQSSLAKARDSLRKSHLKKLAEVLINYYDARLTFPPVSELNACNLPLKFGNYVYLPSVPCDPITHQPYYFELDPALGIFRVYTTLEYKQDQIIKQLKCHKGCAPLAGCVYNYGVTSSNTTVEKCYQPEIWACSPGNAGGGNCERYSDIVSSGCPISFEDDPTCRNLCGQPASRCQNNSGKISDPHQTPTPTQEPTPTPRPTNTPKPTKPPKP